MLTRIRAVIKAAKEAEADDPDDIMYGDDSPDDIYDEFLPVKNYDEEELDEEDNDDGSPQPQLTIRVKVEGLPTLKRAFIVANQSSLFEHRLRHAQEVALGDDAASSGMQVLQAEDDEDEDGMEVDLHGSDASRPGKRMRLA